MIHSPTLTSTKWWPGELGKVATHAVVAAKLIIDEEDYGIQFFVVPIRSLTTHEVLSGIEVGDLGSKYGYNSKDNGFMRFNKCRIPRGNLLQRYCKVSKDGQLSLDGDPRVLYATMMAIRIWIVSGAWKECSVGTLIAARYSVTRRQFRTLDDKTQERKLLDYQAHQFKIIPAIAQSIVFNLAKNHISD